MIFMHIYFVLNHFSEKNQIYINNYFFSIINEYFFRLCFFNELPINLSYFR
jgi:hypothetical protein